MSAQRRSLARRTLILLPIAVVLAAGPAAGTLSAQDSLLDGRWSLAFELGELPMKGSFKAGVSVGYHLNDKAWIGFAYQIPDSIRRGSSSFNARGVGLDGLTLSTERVGGRAYLQARLRPHRRSPYLSVGVVLNQRDTETLTFDDRPRSLGDAAVEGPLRVRISRPRGIRPALGLGYGVTTASGVSLFVEWAGWWMFGAPTPDLAVSPGVEGEFERRLRERITEDFTRSPFNSYHLFQVGVGISR